MSFHEEYVDKFLATFNQHKEHIRNFKGCRFLELYRDKNNTSIFFTYSYWEDENALQDYRNSKLFKNVWAKTKVLFNDSPEAWSVDKLERLP